MFFFFFSSITVVLSGGAGQLQWAAPLSSAMETGTEGICAPPLLFPITNGNFFSTDASLYFHSLPSFPSQPRVNKSSLAGWFGYPQRRGLRCRVHPAPNGAGAGGVLLPGSCSQGFGEMRLTSLRQQYRGIYWERCNWDGSC